MSAPNVYRGFGPTVAADYLAGKHGIHAGRETVRGWMIDLVSMIHDAYSRLHAWFLLQDSTEENMRLGQALRELDIVWIGAHSPQAKGRVVRSQMAQDRLVKRLRVAGAKTLEQANAYLEADSIPWCPPR